ncbi:unnamed protein product [Schistosoma turkestanicum]|nr:unnamed protein product [Schistosoma turkestanicum]
MSEVNKENRAEYVREILFSQIPERRNAFDVDLLLSEYAELVDNMKNESNHWRSVMTVDMVLRELEAVTVEQSCLLPTQSLPNDFDATKFCSVLTELFEGKSYNQVTEPVKSTNVNLSSIGQKHSSMDFEKHHSSPKRHFKKSENMNYCENSMNSNTEVIESDEPMLFQTAGSLLKQNLDSKQNTNNNRLSQMYGSSKRSLGSRRGVRSSFIPPFDKDSDSTSKSTSNYTTENKSESSVCDERLKQFDQKIVDMIMSEIMDSKSSVTWDDIAGLEFSKKTLQEIVILPMLRPDLFVGLRGPPKGLLLFGPPGTGKTLIGKCIASQSNSTFFSISASSLTSKWVGEGEKLVRALFSIARIHQPSVIFIDEVDSLLTQRSETEHESSRRIKTEFLVQLDGISTNDDERMLFIGATNRPQELDEAARRRFVKRLYIPLPTRSARKQIVQRLLRQNHHTLQESDFWDIADRADGYSGADMANLCREAAMGPIRSLTIEAIQHISCDEVRPVELADFHAAFRQVRASNSSGDLEQYLRWNSLYGSFEV